MATGVFVQCKWRGCGQWCEAPKWLCVEHWRRLAATERVTLFDAYGDAITGKLPAVEYFALVKLVLHRHGAA